MILSYRYRIEPSHTQITALSDMLGDFQQLYNAALEHRIGAYTRGAKVTCYDQSTALPEIRRDLPAIGRWSATAEQQVLRKLDKAYRAFFGRINRGAKAGFPRFKARDRYHAADFRVGDGLTIKKTGKIGFVGVPGAIKVRWHRALPSLPASAILSRNNGKWYVIFHVEVTPAVRVPTGQSIGVDVGLSSLVALSNGETVPRQNFTKQHAARLRRTQRALARCNRRSKNRRKRVATVARAHQHLANRRRDSLHKLSASLVNRFDRIAVEDLNIKGLASGMLAKHVNDASWAQLISMLSYKAEKAGGELVKVNPRGTSQTCPACGRMAPKTLQEREHRCDCGCVLDRDVAAAIVIHARASFSSPPGMGGGSLTEHVA